jgi:hypothetical protein
MSRFSRHQAFSSETAAALPRRSSTSRLRSYFREEFLSVHGTSSIFVIERAIKRCHQRQLVFIVEIVIANDDQIELCPFGQIRWFINDDSTTSDLCFDGQHAAQDIARLTFVPVSGAATPRSAGVWEVFVPPLAHPRRPTLERAPTSCRDSWPPAGGRSPPKAVLAHGAPRSRGRSRGGPTIHLAHNSDLALPVQEGRHHHNGATMSIRCSKQKAMAWTSPCSILLITSPSTCTTTARGSLQVGAPRYSNSSRTARTPTRHGLWLVPASTLRRPIRRLCQRWRRPTRRRSVHHHAVLSVISQTATLLLGALIQGEL